MQTDSNEHGSCAGGKPFEPTSWLLTKMIERAEAKFAADRKRALDERAEYAHRVNALKKNERRQHDARRYINAGDKP